MFADKKNAQLYHPAYRSDIDGMRGIAVLLVVLFHAFPNADGAGYFVGGGFIGVDIFFVISGFLISSIILKSLNSNTFNFIQFYEKRLNRIFPALIVVLTFSLIFGWFILLPHEYRQLGKHVRGAVTYTNNIMFWKESGYFDNESISKPLLHLWSLSIEEQFYICWPFLLWLGHRGKLNFLMIILGLLFLSFSLHIHTIQSDKVSAFYAANLRAWELLAGAVVAYIETTKINILLRLRDSRDNKHDLLQNLMSTLGLFLIVAGVLVIDKDKAFPGWWAMLFPVMGTALIIAASERSWINRTILSNKSLVFFGLISYPLYLWHWPLLSFSAIIYDETPSTNIRILLVLLSIILAWATYQFIEKPVRFGSSTRTKNIILIALMLFIGIVGIAVNKKLIAPLSNKLAIAKYFDFSGYPAPLGEHIDAENKIGMLGTNTRSKVYLIGDSHAGQYRNTFSQLYIRNHSLGNSIPSLIYNIDYVDVAGLVKLSNEALKDSTVTTVVYSKFWAATYGSDQINYAVRCCGNGQGGSVGGDSHHQPLTTKDMDMIDLQLEGAASSLIKAGKKVYFILDSPFGQELAPRGLVKRTFFHGIKFSPVRLSKEIAIRRTEPSRSRIVNIANKTGSEIIDPIEYLCSHSSCPPTTIDGIPLYKDYDHLSLYAVSNDIHYLDFLILN